MPISLADMGDTTCVEGQVGRVALPTASDDGRDACSPGSVTGAGAAMNAGDYAASCGFSRCCLLCSLFKALTYAFADATRISVSAPRPLTIRPSLSSRTVTSPWASVPVVMALTE